jgi:uncharacterized damage-inducible protein DinB
MRLLDACTDLAPELLEQKADGTYGSVIDTLRHTVAADRTYLHLLTGGEVAAPTGEEGDIPYLRRVMEENGEAWRRLLAADPDPEAVVVRKNRDGSESRAPCGFLLAQAVHHGTDHRSQVCTALTIMGIEPPEIDVWAFAWEEGVLVETEPL